MINRYKITNLIIDKIEKEEIKSIEDLNKLKVYLAKKYRLTKVPSNSELLSMFKERKHLTCIKQVLKRKKTRSLSGVNVIAVMTHPFPCPKAKPCIYCPGGPDSVFGNVPQSYTGKEPAAMRAIQNKFNPYLQVKHRIKQLKAIGHEVSKVELIIMGGTFPAAPTDYQRWFVKGCLDAITNKETRSLDEAKREAERSQIRNVGITVETRPDYSKEEQVSLMLDIGVTRVELGVQAIDDNIYRLINRGHKVRDVIEATRTLKDAGLKVGYHIMPGLPGSNPEKDIEMAERIFKDPGFKPDMLKIYPTLVVKGTELYEIWRNGLYKPYSLEETIRVVAEIKSKVPEWIRIMRIQRDIPASQIIAGVKKSNLREIVKEYMKERGLKCRCIRCNEVGRVKNVDLSREIEINIKKYDSSGGKDFFISARLDKAIVGFLRLRFPSNKVFRPELRGRSSVVRELHVYGEMIPVGQSSKGKKAYQHRGVGKRLLRVAEEISRSYYKEKILVTSALGVKDYYFRQGYNRCGAYVCKYFP